MKYPKRWFYYNVGKKQKPIIPKPLKISSIMGDSVLMGNENDLTLMFEYYPEKRYRQKLRAMWLTEPF